MTEEEKKAIEYFKEERKNIYKYSTEHEKNTDIILNLIQNQQKEIEKKNKMIDLISEKLAKAYHYKFNKCSLKEKEQNNIDCDKYKDCTSCIKQYLENKVEGE